MKFIGEGLKKEGPNFNVLNLMRALVEDSDSSIFLPIEEYEKRIFHTSDPAIHFVKHPCKATNIISNSEEFNFSLQFLVPIKVEVEENKIIYLEDKFVFRTYNIIRNGILLVKSLYGILSEEAFNKLNELDLLYYNGAKVEQNHKYCPDYTYKINLQNVPLASNCWANPEHMGLVAMMVKEDLITRQAKFYNNLIKTMEKVIDSSEESNIYNEKSSYIKSDKEKTQVPCIVYSIENPSELITEEINNYEILKKKIKELKSQQTNYRFLIRAMLFSIENTKNKGEHYFKWSELEEVPRSKTKKRQYTTIENILIKREEYTKGV